MLNKKKLSLIGLFFGLIAILGVVSNCDNGVFTQIDPSNSEIAVTDRATGFYVSGTTLYDANGSPFVIRGISHAHTWYASQLDSSLAGIKSLGGNAVRVVLSNGYRWTKNTATEVASIISKCKTNQLIAILEVHDTTGYGEDGAACTLDAAANYWIELASVLKGQEKYVIINIGNEPVGNNQAASVWTNGHVAAIQKLRSNGFTHTLMVDAANWGQDWEAIMSANAKTVWNADTLKNTVFSIHMYEVYATASAVTNYLATFRTLGLPLVVGEFADNHKGAEVDEATIMSACKTYGNGYIGWSYCGNSSDLVALDVVNSWNVSSLTTWGNKLVNGTNGLKATSKVCTVFTGATPTPTATATPTPTATPTATATPTPTVTTTTRLEAEKGTLSGVSIATTTAGYSGTGYVTGFDASTDTLTVTYSAAAAGSYTLAIGYRSPYSEKTQYLNINGTRIGNIVFPTATSYAKLTYGSVTLKTGSNTIQIANYWGYCDIDYFDVTGAGSATPTPTATPTATPTPTATATPTPTATGGYDESKYTLITTPFTKDGTGEFYWMTNSLSSYVNSWNVDTLTINGVSYKNTYVHSNTIPLSGDTYKYYIYYKASIAWAHFESK